MVYKCLLYMKVTVRFKCFIVVMRRDRVTKDRGRVNEN